MRHGQFKQYQTGKKIRGRCPQLPCQPFLKTHFHKISFLWGLYGVFSNLFKSLGGHLMSIRKGLNNLEKFRYYLNLVYGQWVYLGIDELLS
jgi:hypothetical protein